MDYSRMLAQHIESKAEVTLATLPVSPDESKRFGIVEVARNGEIRGFRKSRNYQHSLALQSRLYRCVDGHLHFNTEILLKH